MKTRINRTNFNCLFVAAFLFLSNFAIAVEPEIDEVLTETKQLNSTGGKKATEPTPDNSPSSTVKGDHDNNIDIASKSSSPTPLLDEGSQQASDISGNDTVAPSKMRVILMAGQSNMHGKGSRKDYDRSLGDVPDHVTYFSNTKGSLTDFKQSDSFYNSSYFFGPEVMFVNSLTNETDENFVVIKFAVSSTTLNDWAPDGELYKTFIANIRSALDDVSNPNGYQFDALLWQQGESDCYNRGLAINYLANLENFVANLRKDLQAPEMSIILGMATPPKAKHDTEVQEGQRTFANEDPHAKLIMTEDLVRREKDRIHYDSEGQLELGTRFFEAYQELKKTP
ncbi:MAG: sialate O-acetylesterase [Cyanobacteria bacterium P01_H01_bin.15]